jgi:predicted nucleic acid-binding protein
VAQQFGLRVIGTIGTLLEAKAKGAIGQVRPCLDALRQTAGFYLSDTVYNHALELAN